MIVNRSQPWLGKSPKQADESLFKKLPLVHDLHFSDEDLTAEGKLPVIMTSPDRKLLRELKKACRCTGLSKEEYDPLPLVRGIALDVDPRNPRIHQFLQRAQKLGGESLRIHLDKKIAFEPAAPLPGQPSPSAEAREKIAAAIDTLGIKKVWEKGFTGKGVTIVIIDSGIFPHPDLKDRMIAWHDFVNDKPQPYDEIGHGTHVSGDAGSDGKSSDGLYTGTAPNANLIGLKVANASDAIKALQWVMDNKSKFNIKVVNMSLGVDPAGSYRDDPWAQAAEKVVDAGIVTVVAAGNDYQYGTIDTPGYDPKVITIGAFDDRGTADRSDDRIADFSSRGPTPFDNLPKPDLVGPGVNVTSTLSPGSLLDPLKEPWEKQKYLSLSGTSMATPLVAGIIATILEANPDLTPLQVKEILMKTATRMPGYDGLTQGAGVPDPLKALEAALAMKGTKAA